MSTSGADRYRGKGGKGREAHLEHLDKGDGEVEVGLVGEDEGAAEEDGDREY